jgi:hypothetical protein
MLWDTCEDANEYMRKLQTKVVEFEACHIWTNKISAAHQLIEAISHEMNCMLQSSGAFNPINKA